MHFGGGMYETYNSSIRKIYKTSLMLHSNRILHETNPILSVVSSLTCPTLG